MRIRELAEVTGVQVAHIKDLRQRRILPFESTPDEVRDGGGRVWSTYSIHDAMYLIAAQNLVAGQGVSWSEASAMLRAKAIHLAEAGDRYRGPNFYCIRVMYQNEAGKAPNLGPHSEVYRGSLAGVIAAIERAVIARNDRTHFPSDFVEVESIAAVNLSQAFAVAMDRADALQINLDAGFAPEMGADE